MAKRKTKRVKGHMRGDGVIEDIGKFFNSQKVKDVIGGVDKFLKQSKIASKVGQVLLPAAGGALAGLATVNPLGAAAGAAGGLAINDFLKAQGYGRMRGKGYATKPLMLGSGMTYGYNGVYQPIPGTMRGMGGTAYGSVSSEFGRIQA
jgi:hypothetical protein